MPARSRLGALLLGVLAAALLTIPATGSAAAVADTQVLDEFSCNTDAFFAACADIHDVFHTTTLPTGRTIVGAETRLRLRLVGVAGGPADGCTASLDQSANDHFTAQDDITISNHANLHAIDTQSCPDGLNLDCTNTIHLQLVHGRLVMDRFTVVCQPV